ncbi:MAG: DNA polymerase III subunit gamma/tau [Pseudomonadota bacterium]
MSYLVLARKYRPKKFSDVVGQEHVVRPLANALATGRIAHAFLFSGARGVGKTTVARLLAMALLCLSEKENNPCGECTNCLEIIEGHAPDVFEIDGASNRGIDEIRNLRETIKYLPGKGRYKVYIIDEVHMLTEFAFNALLKTLEEPPEHVVFIFATTAPHKVLPTILSRCQRYDFKRITLDQIVARMEEIAGIEGIEIGPRALRILARESEGSLRDALSLFDQVIAFSGLVVKDEDVPEALGLINQAMISSLVRSVLAGRAGEALDLVEKAYNFGHDAKDFALQVLEYLRALVVVKVAREPEKILDLLDAELAEVKDMASSVSLETLNFHFKTWLEAQDSLRRSTHPRLVLESMVIRLAQVEPLTSLAELTARLESLLKKAAQEGGPAGGADAGGRRAGPLPESKANIPAPVRGGAADWSDFLQMVREKSPLRLHAVLQQCEVRKFTSARVELALSNNGLRALFDREELLALLTGFFGVRPQLEIQLTQGAAASEAEKQTRSVKATDQAREEVLKHPLVQEAEQLFSGEVIDVIPEK